MEERRVISLENIKVACKNCSLNALCLPMGLTIEDDERLDSIVKRNRPLHRGDALFRQGDRFKALYIVKTGSVKTFTPRAMFTAVPQRCWRPRPSARYPSIAWRN